MAKQTKPKPRRKLIKTEYYTITRKLYSDGSSIVGHDANNVDLHHMIGQLRTHLAYLESYALEEMKERSTIVKG